MKLVLEKVTLPSIWNIHIFTNLGYSSRNARPLPLPCYTLCSSSFSHEENNNEPGLWFSLK